MTQPRLVLLCQLALPAHSEIAGQHEKSLSATLEAASLRPTAPNRFSASAWKLLGFAGIDRRIGGRLLSLGASYVHLL
jgi:hypothetical protein